MTEHPCRDPFGLDSVRMTETESQRDLSDRSTESVAVAHDRAAAIAVARTPGRKLTGRLRYKPDPSFGGMH